MLLALALLEHYRALNPRDFENWLIFMPLWRYVNNISLYQSNISQQCAKKIQGQHAAEFWNHTRRYKTKVTKETQVTKKMKISLQPGLCSWKRLQRLGKMGRKTKKHIENCFFVSKVLPRYQHMRDTVSLWDVAWHNARQRVWLLPSLSASLQEKACLPCFTVFFDVSLEFRILWQDLEGQDIAWSIAKGSLVHSAICSEWGTLSKSAPSSFQKTSWVLILSGVLQTLCSRINLWLESKTFWILFLAQTLCDVAFTLALRPRKKGYKIRTAYGS